MKSFLERNNILSFIEQNNMLKKGDEVLIALSGGADSVCLLFVLLTLKEQFDLKLTAVHVNHMIRGKEADEDAAFVEKLCDEVGIKCVVRTVDVPALAKESGRSLEEEARLVRYGIFEEFDCDRIAVAHNANDNAETVIFHMARGCGLDGAVGIPAVRGKIIRPLLMVSKEEIVTVLKEKEIAFCVDSTNFDVDYDRNRIRHNVLGELSKINPLATEHISKMAAKLAEVADFVGEQASGLLQEVLEEDESLNVDKLLAAPSVLRMAVIKEYCSKAMPNCQDVSESHLMAIEGLLASSEEKRVNLPHQKIAIISAGRLSVRDGVDESVSCEVVLDKEALLKGECVDCHYGRYAVKARVLQSFEADMREPRVYTKYVDYDKMKFDVKIRKRAPGDYLIVNSKGGSKSLSDYLINEKVPKWQRDEIPVVADGDHVIWAVGYRISEFYKITDETKLILELSIMEENKSE